MSPWPNPAQLAAMCHADQLQAIVAMGRAEASDPAARDALSALEAEGVWGRSLALRSAYGSRDNARILRGVADPSAQVNRIAVKLAARLCGPEEACLALEGARGARARRQLLARLSRRGVDAADRSAIQGLDGTPNDVAVQVVELLPYCTEPTILRFIPRFIELASWHDWVRLAASRPALCVEAHKQALAARGTGDPRTLHSAVASLDELTGRAPEAALGLVAALFERGFSPTDPRIAGALARLAVQRPPQLFDLLRGLRGDEAALRPPGAFAAVQFRKNAEKLGVQRLAYLIQHAWQSLSDQKTHWFSALGPDERRDLVKLWMAVGRSHWGGFLFRHAPSSGPLAPLRESAWKRWQAAARDRTGLIAVEKLAELPEDLRWPEARAAFDHPKLAQRPEARLAYLSLLPLDEAVRLADPYLKHPEGDTRALALAPILKSLELDRAALLRGLAMVKARKFEQDPVRRVMLGALAGLRDRVWAPKGQLAAEALAAAEGVLADAYEAADLSAPTARHAEALSLKLFRYAPDWGLNALERAWKSQGTLHHHGLLDGLSRADRERLSPALCRLGERWCRQERWGAFSWLISSIGRYLPQHPPLVRALEQVVRETPFTGYTGLALALAARWNRAGMTELAVQLVQEDPSYAVFSEVATRIAHARQDLLPRFIRDEPIVGRFATGRSAWSFFFPSYTRWSPALQAVVARHFARIVEDPERDMPTKLRAIHDFPRLVYVDPAPLLRWSEDPHGAIREAGTRALARLDGPERLPALLAALGDDRARWAIYALRQVFAVMPEEEVLRTLLAAPRAKVSVAKEVVRLIGTLASRPAYEALHALNRQELHRDVRIALLRAFWGFLEIPETWAIFEAAAQDPDWVLATRLADLPTGRLSSGADQRLCGLLARVLDRPEEEARVGLLSLVVTNRLRDDSRALFGAVLRRIGAPTTMERVQATRTAFVLMKPDEVGALSGALGATLGNPRAVLDLGPFVKAFCSGWAAPHCREVGRQFLRALLQDPLNIVPALALAGGLLDTEELCKSIEATLSRGPLGVDAMQAAIAAVQACAKPEFAELRWRKQADPQLRRLGLAALESAARPGEGWSAARREALAQYRADPHPDIAAPARFVLPPD